jgi:hypothetical protein
VRAVTPCLGGIRATRLHAANGGSSCVISWCASFANDAWSFYDNNRGSVTLTITRLD